MQKKTKLSLNNKEKWVLFYVLKKSIDSLTYSSTVNKFVTNNTLMFTDDEVKILEEIENRLKE